MTDRPIKVLIAKPGLDGHDRGAKVLARGLRDEGFEVVYTGLRQTPEMIATAALQEDVDVVGLSILSGAHMTLLPRITRLLRDQGMDDVLVTAGGIIPDDDVPALKAAGVAEVFGPGTTIAQVADYLRANVRPRDGVSGGRRVRAARRSSMRPAPVIGGRSPAADRGREPHAGRRGRPAPALPAGRRRAHLVGITGPPGAGKSTLVAALIAEVREAGRTVAVIAVDPSSPDHRRRHARRPGPDAELRRRTATCSSARWRRAATRAGWRATSSAAAAVLDACGFDLVLIETVGTGQSEVEVAAAADTTVVLQAPEMGDEVQAIKAGLLEVADIVVVNKADSPGAQRTAAQLRAMLVRPWARGAAGAAAIPSGHDRSVPRCSSRPPRPATACPSCSRRWTGTAPPGRLPRGRPEPGSHVPRPRSGRSWASDCVCRCVAPERRTATERTGGGRRARARPIYRSRSTPRHARRGHGDPGIAGEPIRLLDATGSPRR